MSLFLTIIFTLIILVLLHATGLILAYRQIKIYKKVEIDGYTMHYRSSGKGSKKVLLIHGMFSNLHCWDSFLKFKSENVEYISIDLPQMGESQTKNLATPVYRIEDLIFNFSKHLKLNSPSIVGCSLGGLAAYLAKVKYPDYFDKCIIVASPFNTAFLNAKLYKISFLSPVANLMVNPIIIAFSYARIAKTTVRKSIKRILTIFCKFRNPQHFRSSIEYLQLISIVEQKLEIPTKVENYFFIWGTGDKVVKKSGFQAFLGQNQRLNYDEIPEASHHPMESHPTLFAKKLSGILNS